MFESNKFSLDRTGFLQIIRSLDTIMLTSWAPHSLIFPCKEGAGRSTYLFPCPLYDIPYIFDLKRTELRASRYLYLICNICCISDTDLFHWNNENGLKLFESNRPYLVLFSYQHNHYKIEKMTVLEELSVVRRNIFDAIKKSFIHSGRSLHPSKIFHHPFLDFEVSL